MAEANPSMNDSSDSPPHRPPTRYSSVVSLPLPSDDELDPEAASLLRKAADLNVVRMFAGTGDLFKPTLGLVRAMFETSGIEPRTRELIILRCAKLLDCPYEWQANAVMARNAGCSPSEIDAMAEDGPVSGQAPDATLVCTATDELTKTGTLTDATLGSMLDRFDAMTCRKLILMIGWFNLLSRFLNGCRVPLEMGDKLGTRTSPL